MVNGRGMQNRILCALFVACSFVFFGTLHATTVTDAYDQPSTSVIATASNHKIVMTIANAISEGSTMTVTFATGFTMTSITEDDIDIADDGVDLTTAANCSGTDQASAGISGQIITFTICSGDGGAIASGSQVIIEIGLNATASGTGANRITNPSSVGTYFVNIAGTFSGSGSIPLAITTNSGGNVTANVLPSGVSGGGGGGSSGGGAGSDSGSTDSGDTSDTTDTTDSTDTTPDTTDTSDTADTTETTDTTSTDGETTADATDASDGSSSDTSGTDSSSGETSSGGASGSSSDTGTSSGDSGTSDTSSSSGSGSTSAEVSVDVSIIADGGLVLAPSGSTFGAIGGTEATIVVDVESDERVEGVSVLVDGVAHVLTESNDGTYTGTITVPTSDASISVEVTTAAGTTQETYFVDARGSGLVYEIIDGRRVPISGAVVTVYSIIGGTRIAWNASDYGESNPIVAGADGLIAWYVPNGTYVVIAGKSGFDDASKTITVTDHILSPSIEMVRMEPVAITDTEEPASLTSTTVVAKIANVIASLRMLPEIQVGTDIAIPTTVVLAAASTIILASSFSLLPFLQYLFTSPILFFARRRRKAFGTVYNAATKLPVDLATVRLFSLPERRLLRTVVTDAQGKYLLSAAPGIYAIIAQKVGFAFPSQILQGKKDDGTFLDVYTGQEITVSEKEATISANIPLDPANTPELHTPRSIAFKRFFRVLQHGVAIVGVLLGLVTLVLAPSIFTACMLLVQIFVYVLVRRLVRTSKPKGWGIVYDGVSKNPVGNAIVRLFEPTYNKLIETVLTDRLGRYAFLVGPNEYYVTYSKPGYDEKIVRPVDYRAKQEATALAFDIPIDAQHEEV